MDEKTLVAQLDALKSELKSAVTAEAKASVEAQIKAIESKIPDTKGLNDDIAALKEWSVKKDEADKKNQDALDKVIAGSVKTSRKIKSFGEALSEAIAEKESDLIGFGRKRDSQVTLDLKGVDLNLKLAGDMTQSASLTGDPVVSYSSRNGLIPADAINFRDLIPTSISASGTYVHYTEQAGQGDPAQQTEGSGKAQIDSDFTEVKTVTKYLAAYQRFSKQLMYNLPWLQTTLGRILLRRFYQKENTLFYQNLAVNSDPHSASGGNVAEKIIDLIATQRGNNFNASAVLITFTDWTNLMKTAYPSTGDSYSVPGGVVFDNNGLARIAGVPVIAAPWVTAGDIQIMDTDYIERVETESLRVEFSFEDADNFTKNLVTARIECMEELNLIRTDAHLNIGTAS